jgi:hypothetical protein
LYTQRFKFFKNGQRTAGHCYNRQKLTELVQYVPSLCSIRSNISQSYEYKINHPVFKHKQVSHRNMIHGHLDQTGMVCGYRYTIFTTSFIRNGWTTISS